MFDQDFWRRPENQPNQPPRSVHGPDVFAAELEGLDGEQRAFYGRALGMGYTVSQAQRMWERQNPGGGAAVDDVNFEDPGAAGFDQNQLMGEGFGIADNPIQDALDDQRRQNADRDAAAAARAQEEAKIDPFAVAQQDREDRGLAPRRADFEQAGDFEAQALAFGGNRHGNMRDKLAERLKQFKNL